MRWTIPAIGLLFLSPVFAQLNTSPLLAAPKGQTISDVNTLEKQSVGEDEQDADGDMLGRCLPVDVRRSDYFLDVTSTLPHYPGPAHLEIHVVSPVYAYHRCEHRRRTPVVFVHGSSWGAETSFDLQYLDYSTQEALARNGLDTIAYSRLGFGRSSRFGLDDACNASLADQMALLIPNPLSETCPNPDPFHFTNSQVWQDELDQVVNHVMRVYQVGKVNLFARSRGGTVAGPYASLHPEKVKRVVFYASGYNLPNHEPPDPLPQPGPALQLLTQTGTETDWLRQTDLDACPGEIDTPVLETLWNSILAHDGLGASWGTSGLNRVPSQDIWGWDHELASAMIVPTLQIGGLLDQTVLPIRQTELYEDLGNASKVLIRLECASHYAIWEAAASWVGPHTLVQRAAVEWLLHGTFNGTSNGQFYVDRNGVITGPF